MKQIGCAWMWPVLAQLICFIEQNRHYPLSCRVRPQMLSWLHLIMQDITQGVMLPHLQWHTLSQNPSVCLCQWGNPGRHHQGFRGSLQHAPGIFRIQHAPEAVVQGGWRAQATPGCPCFPFPDRCLSQNSSTEWYYFLSWSWILAFVVWQRLWMSV